MQKTLNSQNLSREEVFFKNSAPRHISKKNKEKWPAISNHSPLVDAAMMGKFLVGADTSDGFCALIDSPLQKDGSEIRPVPGRPITLMDATKAEKMAGVRGQRDACPPFKDYFDWSHLGSRDEPRTKNPSVSGREDDSACESGYSRRRTDMASQLVVREMSEERW